MPEQTIYCKLTTNLAADIAGKGREHGRNSVTLSNCRDLRLRRRDLLAAIPGGAAALIPLRVKASEPVHIGFVSGGDQQGAADFLTAFLDGLRAEGYREPGTLMLDSRYADWSLDRVPALVAELEKQKVALIVTHAAATPVVVKGYRTVPVVYEFSADPVATGIASDLAHPLFKATGITLLRAELNGKRLEFLQEIIPDLRRVAVIANPLHPGEAREREDLQGKAEQLGIRLTFFSTPNRAELDRALDASNLPLDDWLHEVPGRCRICLAGIHQIKPPRRPD